MKIAKLLALGAVLLFGSNAAQAVDDNVWTKPSPAEYATWVEGEEYYLYNTGSGLLFTQGNAWGTQASIGTSGLKVKIESVEGMEGVYHIIDYCESKSAWLWWWFVDDGVSMYVDYNGQADHLWEITSMGDQVYRLAPSAQNPTVNNNTLFVGLNTVENPANTALSANNEAGSGAFIDWKFLPIAAGETYMTQVKIYTAAMQLKDLLNKAEEIGANVADQIAVYNNTNSTLEEIEAAIAATEAAIKAREDELALENIDKATVENPVNVTNLYIKNPSFIGNKYTDWSGTGFGSYNPKDNAEHYNKTYDTYQQITGMREGVYKLNVVAFYRAGDAQTAYNHFKAQDEASRYAKVYAATTTDSLVASIASPFTPLLTEQVGNGGWVTATDDETGMVYTIPNYMDAAADFFAAGYCNDNSVIIAVSDGNLKIGVRKDNTIGNDWSIFNEFSLTYYGNGNDAFELIKNSSIANLETPDLTDVVFTQSYLDAFNDAANALRAATSKEEIMSAMAAIQSAEAALKKNVELWKKFQEMQEKALATAARDDIDPDFTYDLADWAEFDAKEILQARTYTNEQLEEEIANVQAMISEAMRHPMPPADMTDLMVNPNFTQYGEGWTRVAASGGNVTAGGLASNPCYEAWNNSNFDIYQVVENAPVGVYEIKVQGFYRYGRTAFQAFLNGETYTTRETCPVFVYMNSNATPFTNVYGDPTQIYDATFYSEQSSDYSSETLPDGTVVYFPNGMQSASVAFAAGMYTQSAYGLIAQEGDPMRIGVKGASNQLGDSWSIWDNFQLVYQGYAADVIRPVLEQAIIDGENALNGSIGTDVYADLQAAIAQAKEVVNGDEGKAMFEALTKLFDMQEAVNQSKALFAKLEEANERLAAAISYAVASADIIAEANALNASIADGLQNHSYANSDVEDLINQINRMINRLGLPVDMANASDANPVECTTVIVNPAYVEGNDNGWTGGAAVNATANDAEKFNTNFNYFQLLQGLPAGTYKVSVQGFFRYGSAKNDYDTFIADPTANNNSFLYAAAGEDTVSVALHRLASQALVMEGISDGWVYANEESFLAVPNSMATGADAFQTPGADGTPLYANNNVIVKVGEEGKLVIGLKKDVQVTDDWTLWTNWQLFYYGNNSALEPSGNPLSIDEMNGVGVVSAEIFTVNGTRTSTLQRGINIVRETLSDGTVRMKKVTVK